ncbi:MAG: polysaccharide pyruvyl transferase family protein, partial [Methanobacterium sp.]|nr:polysaccharide pyruvyl transferase family protein [Methanobacterium sp.]
AAFSLIESDALKIEQILLNEGVYELKTPIIGLNPSKLITKFFKNFPNKEEKIINIFINTIDELNKKDFNILLIPHVYTSTDDDRIIINEISKKIQNKSKLHIIKGEYNPEELKGIIKRCDIFVGARMHATIASTSMFIPTVGIAYSHKMHGIIGEMLGLEDYIIDIDNLNYEILLEKIMMAWENQKDIHNHLKKVIPEVKKRSMRNGELVKKLVDSLNIS